MRMKLPFRSLALASLLTATCFAEPEPMPAEEAQRIAHKLNDAIGHPADAPLAADVDPDKPQGLKAGGVGLMVLPDRKLAADALASAGKEVTPLGQLWTLSASVAADGRPLASDRLRLVRIADGDKSVEVQLYYLGAAKNEAGELQLVVFAKDKSQPVLRVPLQKATGASQSSPIEITGRKQDENTGILTLRIVGEYSAEVALMKPE
jgi:hypothetical protein